MLPFDGTEKKCKVIMSEGSINLRSLDIAFWKQMVEMCSATIISSIHNDLCDAYVLSESSLFVWSDELLIITCGQTKLVESILYLLQKLGSNSIEQLLFQRKNERMPSDQSTGFSQDVERIEALVNGVTVSFGNPNYHSSNLFHRERLYTPKYCVYELLMYGISQDSSQYFTQADLDCKDIRERLSLIELFQGWLVDDFVFSPFGYSLNALKDDWYCTIHLTPQTDSSYCSLETNAPITELFQGFLNVLQPESFDWRQYQSNSFESIPIIHKAYTLRHEQSVKIDEGYSIYFQDWNQTF